MRERITSGAVKLGQVPERERVLEVSGDAGLVDRGTGQEIAEAGEGRAKPGMRPDDADPRVKQRRVGREAVQAQRAGDIEHVEEAGRVVDRESRPRRREGVVREKRCSLACHEREPFEDRQDERGQRGEVALSDRTDRADGRELVPREPVQEPVRELRPHARRAFGEVVRETHERRAQDVPGHLRTLADDVMPEHRRGVLRPGADGDVDPLQDAYAGRGAVDSVTPRECRHGDRM